MSIVGTSRYVERNEFFNGQRLFASDLQAVEAFNREMRWLHNMSLHQPGIGSGLATRGAKGDRSVVIEPGYAIDADGREIVLTERVIQPVPPVAGDEFGEPAHFDLTISYPDEPLTRAETREGVCAPRGAVRLRETPVLCWIRLGPPPDRLPRDDKLREQVQRGKRLRLARAEVLNCQLERSLSLAERRNARPPEQPYVACGRALSTGEPPDLVWKVIDSGAIGFELRTPVKTLAARFRTDPCYTAHLIGSRDFTFTLGNAKEPRRLDGFVTLIAPGPTGFDFSLFVPDSLLNPEPPETRHGTRAPRLDPNDATFKKELTDQIADKNHAWLIEWMGVEG